MNKKLVILGSAIIALTALLFWMVNAQPPTKECLANCGFMNTGNLYLTSLLPLTLGTLGIWLFVVGMRRR